MYFDVIERDGNALSVYRHEALDISEAVTLKDWERVVYWYEDAEPHKMNVLGEMRKLGISKGASRQDIALGIARDLGWLRADTQKKDPSHYFIIGESRHLTPYPKIRLGNTITWKGEKAYSTSHHVLIDLEKGLEQFDDMRLPTTYEFYPRELVGDWGSAEKYLKASLILGETPPTLTRGFYENGSLIKSFQ